MEESSAQSPAAAPPNAPSEAATPPATDHLRPPIESAIVEHIATGCPHAFLRHQQSGDPDMTPTERRQLVTDLWQQGVRPFLARFRHSLTVEHLDYFASRSESPTTDGDAYEIAFYVRDSRERLANRNRDIRNRRFLAMQRMLHRDSDSSYFAEAEMAAREPLLYERLVGQYLTASERRRLEDGDRMPDEEEGAEGEVAGGVQFSRVLLDGIAKEHVQELRRQQQAESLGHGDMEEEEEDSESSEDEEEENGNSSMQVDGDEEEEYYPQVPPSFQQHWGDFEEEDKPATAVGTTSKTATTSAATKPPTSVQKTRASAADRRQKYVTATEKEVLRDEFYATMYENFLEGRDREFDYAAIDDNADYDDLEQLARDKEDKYFEASDDDGEMEAEVEDGASEAAAALASSSLEDEVAEVAEVDEESEDELDKYMREINASIVQ